MPFYQNLNGRTKEDRRTIERLLRLREVLNDTIPERTQSRTILLATWNIRDFDKSKYGYRLDESMYYIAEIIDRFDIVAVQEVYKDLTALNRLMRLLGGHWDYIFSDATEGQKGNSERMAYLFDTRKVKFGGLVGELVLPSEKRDGEYVNVDQVWRTPLMCGFKAGWARFVLTSVHIQWGSDKPDSPKRVKEIRAVAQFLKKRTEDPNAWARKMVLLGDFNIFNTADPTFNELMEAGFTAPIELEGINSNVKGDRSYDQIVFREKENSMECLSAGTVDFFDLLFTLDDLPIYEHYLKDYVDGKKTTKKKWKDRTQKQKLRYYKDWRTHQISDHKPLWVELKVDYADAYLERKLRGKV